jgi:hypothetical protein
MLQACHIGTQDGLHNLYLILRFSFRLSFELGTNRFVQQASLCQSGEVPFNARLSKASVPPIPEARNQSNPLPNPGPSLL